MDEGRPRELEMSHYALHDHVLGSGQYVATLAYKMTATKYPHGVTASEAMRDSEFHLRVLERRYYVMSLNTAWVEIANPFELYLFEPYCAMELGTGIDTGDWNTFATY